MLMTNRRGVAIFFLVSGICLVALTIALNVGWIFLSLEQIALLILGVIFFALIITGLVLNTIFLFREIRRNEQHNAFINAVTHELKTPVASLKLYLETLKTREVADEQRREFYDSMLADTDRLHRMIEQVLNAGRTSNRSRKLHHTKVQLNRLLDESAAIVRSRYKLDDAAMTLQTDSEVRVRGDAQELAVAFTNLFDNAVKYSKETVRVRVAVVNHDDKRVEITVKDQGIGISQAELKRIFHRFYRVANRSTQKVKGTGLGLAIVQAIIRKHGGKIFAASDGENRGSTFVVRLPKA